MKTHGLDTEAEELYRLDGLLLDIRRHLEQGQMLGGQPLRLRLFPATWEALSERRYGRPGALVFGLNVMPDTVVLPDRFWVDWKV